jgi:hypothetical protein
VLPVLIGVLLFKKLLKGKQIAILLLIAISLLMKQVLREKIFVLEDTKKIARTYDAVVIYNYPLGGKVRVYQKPPKEDKNGQRTLVEEKEKGFSGILDYLVTIKKTFALVSLLGIIFLIITFIVPKKKLE